MKKSVLILIVTIVVLLLLLLIMYFLLNYFSKETKKELNLGELDETLLHHIANNKKRVRI